MKKFNKISGNEHKKVIISWNEYEKFKNWLKRDLNVISRAPPCKDINAQFTRTL